MRIAFLCPYPFGKAPGQRFRYEQYLQQLSEQGYQYKVFPFLDSKTNSILYNEGYFIQKIIGIMLGFLKRIVFLVLYSRKYDYIFVYREASPIGPPVFEYVLSRLFKKKIIYDFDDAIWMSQEKENNFILAKLKNHAKVKNIIKWSYKISCGNEYLADFAKRYNKIVCINPTTIDTEHLHNRIKDQFIGKVSIGWTGTHSNLMYLTPIVPVIRLLEKEYDFQFVVICNKAPEFKLKSLVFKQWSKNTEIEDILSFNIGLMPLVDNEWSKGKCGFKALQYMSLGIPALVSPVGVNVNIVDHNLNGYICKDEKDWYTYIKLLLDNPELRTELGKSGRQKIEDKYSVNSNKANFLNLFS